MLVEIIAKVFINFVDLNQTSLKKDLRSIIQSIFFKRIIFNIMAYGGCFI